MRFPIDRAEMSWRAAGVSRLRKSNGERDASASWFHIVIKNSKTTWGLTAPARLAETTRGLTAPARLADLVLADPGTKDFRDNDAAVGLLIVFQDRDDGSRGGDGRPI